MGVLVGLLVEDLLEPIQMAFPWHGIEEIPSRRQHPGKLFHRQGGEHVGKQLDALPRQGDGKGAGHPKLDGLVLPCGGLHRQLGDVKPAQGRLGQRLVQALGVVALPAAGVTQSQTLPSGGTQLLGAFPGQPAQLLPEGLIIARL